ncbi:uncharacterized protein ACHE_70315A [Aspergillus chevalieri]|uniref:F-box domain-containing protein n=1 Tax=Aspergillus chevalieri TaxID=182096 RepID=A0A7R7ZSJ9_ASPCH|nr:uncharacterized protein ACHE_70315A [Aspergillus chevalieri]BCR91472.1 hypothetical protein ACHE_70315A [Aspergillus chevalieri]
MILDRFSTAVQRIRRSSVLRRRSTRKYSTSQKESFWEAVPSNILIRILAQCELSDIYALNLVCRVLRRRIYQHEPAIAQEYLFRRLHQHYPAFLSPGENLTFIYNLFPPPPPHYPAADGSSEDNLPEYSFCYLTDLTRCWKTCIRLSFYLAESVVQHHLGTDATLRDVSEQEAIYSKAVCQLQDKLLQPIAYLIFFLEFDATTTSSNESQQSILQQPPFTDTQVLISTHHCMTLLCNYLRRLMAPDIQYPSTEPWLRLLLTTSTLERTLNFFAAAATSTTCEYNEKKEKLNRLSDATWTPRMEFIWQMRSDWEQILSATKESIYDPETKNEAIRVLSTAGVEDVWFEAARRELDRRGLIPHACEEGVPVLHEATTRPRCEFCE